MTSATHREVTTTESLMWDIHSSRVFWEDVQPADVVERAFRLCGASGSSIVGIVCPATCLNMYLPSFPTPHWEKGLGVVIKLIVHWGINPTSSSSDTA